MPEDFGDVPVVMSDENGRDQLMTACLLTQVNKLNQIGHGVIHYDEASLAPPATQGAMLPALLNRVVGSTMINPNIRPLLSGNPPKFAAGGHSLAAPFANRMFHFYVQKPSKDSFVNYLISMGSKSKSTVQSMQEKLKKNWPSEWAKARSELAGFIKSSACTDEDYAINPEPDNPQSSYCWPSPRTWVMAMRARATCKCLGVRDEISDMFIEAAVSRGPAIKFIEYLQTADLPDSIDVLEKGWKVDTDRLDRSIAVVTGFTTAIVSTPDVKEKERLAALGWARFDDFIDAGVSDIIMPHTNLFLEHGLGSSCKDKAVSKAASDVLFKLSKNDVARYA
jgi:MoxR-like ATPase